MGTITSRKRRDGSTSHTAQIRIMRKGVAVYQESQTFDRKPAARAWLKKREGELAEPGALERASRRGTALRDIILHYIEQQDAIEPLARTRRASLQATAKTWLGDVEDKDLTSQQLVEFVLWRMSAEGGGVQPQSAGNGLSHLGGVLGMARAAWGYQVDPDIMTDARRVLKGLRVNLKGRSRARRPTLDELDRLLTHFASTNYTSWTTKAMPHLIAFAIFSTRRQEEITTLRWDNLDAERQRVLVKDMKSPTGAIGNDVWCRLPDEAWTIIQSMPRTHPEIFPHNAKTVSAAFTRACLILGIEDLRFHDLRHEGISRLFEMGWDIPHTATVSGHRSWSSLKRYAHIEQRGDKYEGWPWLEKVLELPLKGSPPKALKRRG